MVTGVGVGLAVEGIGICWKPPSVQVWLGPQSGAFATPGSVQLVTQTPPLLQVVPVGQPKLSFPALVGSGQFGVPPGADEGFSANHISWLQLLVMNMAREPAGQTPLAGADDPPGAVEMLYGTRDDWLELSVRLRTAGLSAEFAPETRAAGPLPSTATTSANGAKSARIFPRNICEFFPPQVIVLESNLTNSSIFVLVLAQPGNRLPEFFQNRSHLRE
jgi:hypothetical protein